MIPPRRVLIGRRRHAGCSIVIDTSNRPRRVIAQSPRAAGDDKNNDNIKLRAETPADLILIQKAIFTEGMNPLGLDATRFVVAVDETQGGEVVGFGQGVVQCVRDWSAPKEEEYSFLHVCLFLPKTVDRSVYPPLRPLPPPEGTAVSLL